MEYTVYKHTCPNGKIYIGITSMPVEKRWDSGRKASPVSAETREKLRKASTGRALSDEARRKISESKKGKKASTETKQKMSEKRKGIKFTDAHRAALRDAALQREEKRRQARCLTIEK